MLSRSSMISLLIVASVVNVKHTLIKVKQSRLCTYIIFSNILEWNYYRLHPIDLCANYDFKQKNKTEQATLTTSWFFILDIIASYANSDEIGCRFSSKYLCIWIIGPAGGTLSFSGMESFKLEIPAGALCQPKQLVYMYLYKPPIGEENLEHQMSFSPIVDCGPNGLKFQVRLASFMIEFQRSTSSPF